MNRAMWLQRTHSIYSEHVRRGDQPDFDKDIDKPENRRWYPFQIAFILLEPARRHEARPPRPQRKSRSLGRSCCSSPRAAARPKPIWA